LKPVPYRGHIAVPPSFPSCTAGHRVKNQKYKESVVKPELVCIGGTGTGSEIKWNEKVLQTQFKIFQVKNKIR
jgi:hypothetical protein